MRRIVEGCYARLKGIEASIASRSYNVVDRVHHDDYNEVLKNLRTSLDDEFTGFDLPNNWEWDDTDGRQEPLRAKLFQLLRYLEAVHKASDRIVEIGSLFNLLRDEQLRSRCSDLLSATDHFDRVVNQATQILEDRMKCIVPEFSGLTGAPLVGQAIKKDPAQSRIVFSTDAAIQEGSRALFFGAISVFRNSTHHGFVESMTREQALQICAFIDNLLSMLSDATVQLPE
ncbi:MAG: TIGR02391 family protein [Hyphomicrobiales bacterium]|jgi:hypothetical protein